MEKQLPASLFMRIHKSFIIAFNKTDVIDSNKVIVLTHQLPVSRTLKEKLMITVDDKRVKR